MENREIPCRGSYDVIVAGAGVAGLAAAVAARRAGKTVLLLEKSCELGGLATLGEYGWDGWLGTYFMNFPEPDLTLLVGINVTDTGTCPLTRKIRNAVLAEAGREA